MGHGVEVYLEDMGNGECQVNTVPGGGDNCAVIWEQYLGDHGGNDEGVGGVCHWISSRITGKTSQHIMGKCSEWILFI